MSGNNNLQQHLLSQSVLRCISHCTFCTLLAFLFFSRAFLGSILDLSSDSRVTAGPYPKLHDVIECAPEYKRILTYALAIRLCRPCQTALGFRNLCRVRAIMAMEPLQLRFTITIFKVSVWSLQPLIEHKITEAVFTIERKPFLRSESLS